MDHCRRESQKTARATGSGNSVFVHRKAIAHINTQKLREYAHNLCKPKLDRIPEQRGKSGHEVLSQVKDG